MGRDDGGSNFTVKLLTSHDAMLLPLTSESDFKAWVSISWRETGKNLAKYEDFNEKMLYLFMSNKTNLKLILASPGHFN